ncbi:MAG TPA: GDYXXLXY domain-containing protein [Candidatus Paceibacterota bacterium]
MTKSNRFFLAIALQVIIICAIAVFKLSVASSGTEVLIHIRPVDPRDMLRGDYITFQYDISQLPSYYLQYERGSIPNPGETVYVSLYQSGRYWGVRTASLSRPTDGSVFLKGTVKSSNTQNITVAYGAEEYFIPEGAGRNVSFWNKDAAAALAVDDNGNSVLRRIYIDGKQWP